MEKPAKYKPKNKKPAPKPKTTKKRKQSDGPTCSMFLAEITRKLAAKRRQGEEENPRNIVQTIIESLTNALPVIFSRKTSEERDSVPNENVLNNTAPESLPSETLEIPCPVVEERSTEVTQEVAATLDKIGFKMPKMPLVNSEVIKIAIEKRKKAVMQDASTDTADEHDMASELVKYVSTLRKISMIAEEFNQKTAKNLKEIVDSVQEDLIKKLEEVKAEQRATAAAIVAQAMEVKQFEDYPTEDVDDDTE